MLPEQASAEVIAHQRTIVILIFYSFTRRFRILADCPIELDAGNKLELGFKVSSVNKVSKPFRFIELILSCTQKKSPSV